jgi:hypothetical protein
MSLLDELAAQLVASGVGTLGVNIFLSSRAVIPNGVGPYLTLAETGGVAPTRVQNQTRPITKRPTVQVLTRAGTYPAAREMSRQAYEALDGIFNATLSGTFYIKVTARQEPTDMGIDATGNRVLVVFNIDCEKFP